MLNEAWSAISDRGYNFVVDKSDKIFIAGHRGLVGSALVRKLEGSGFANLVTRDRASLDLRNPEAVDRFFATEKPALAVLAAAKVGGIKANNDLPVEFLVENLQVQNNVIRAAHEKIGRASCRER